MKLKLFHPQPNHPLTFHKPIEITAPYILPMPRRFPQNHRNTTSGEDADLIPSSQLSRSDPRHSILAHKKISLHKPLSHIEQPRIAQLIPAPTHLCIPKLHLYQFSRTAEYRSQSRTQYTEHFPSTLSRASPSTSSRSWLSVLCSSRLCGSLLSRIVRTKASRTANSVPEMWLQRAHHVRNASSPARSCEYSPYRLKFPSLKYAMVATWPPSTKRTLSIVPVTTRGKMASESPAAETLKLCGAYCSEEVCAYRLHVEVRRMGIAPSRGPK